MADLQQVSATHYKLSEVQRIGGFTPEAIPAGATGKMISRCFLHSGETGFYRVLEGMFDAFLGKYFAVDSISQFLIIIHPNMSADVYINAIPSVLKIRAKREIDAFEAIGNKDLADIDELRFVDIEIGGEDRLVYCFKRNWRFGLFFDLDPTPQRIIDTDSLYRDLGRYFRYLSFYDEYATLEDSVLFERLFHDGWFPFMEIMGGDFDKLAEAYKSSESAPGLYSDFVKKFDSSRIGKISSRWWHHKAFEEKKALLRAGIDAYLSGTPSGYINCIKTLQSEIDGILRLEYYKETQRDPRFSDLARYIRSKAAAKFKTEDALGFPALFYRYLDEIVLKQFRLKDGNIQLSRHSSMHGVASGNQYTQEKALQSILTLDQLCWYLG